MTFIISRDGGMPCFKLFDGPEIVGVFHVLPTHTRMAQVFQWYHARQNMNKMALEIDGRIPKQEVPR